MLETAHRQLLLEEPQAQKEENGQSRGKVDSLLLCNDNEKSKQIPWETGVTLRTSQIPHRHSAWDEQHLLVLDLLVIHHPLPICSSLGRAGPHAPVSQAKPRITLQELHQCFELRPRILWKKTSFHWFQDSDDLWKRSRAGSRQGLSPKQALQDLLQMMGPNILFPVQGLLYLPLFEGKGFLPGASQGPRPFLNKHEIFVAPV